MESFETESINLVDVNVVVEEDVNSRESIVEEESVLFKMVGGIDVKTVIDKKL